MSSSSDTDISNANAREAMRAMRAEQAVLVEQHRKLPPGPERDKIYAKGQAIQAKIGTFQHVEFYDTWHADTYDLPRCQHCHLVLSTTDVNAHGGVCPNIRCSMPHGLESSDAAERWRLKETKWAMDAAKAERDKAKADYDARIEAERRQQQQTMERMRNEAMARAQASPPPSLPLPPHTPLPPPQGPRIMMPGPSTQSIPPPHPPRAVFGSAFANALERTP